ncbi:hypothetical protein CY34DRAFT_9185 [Suillus luteus UH-Slu-Lm8-n1]|uniref:Uncharacterized protein n=1 Tax=Suillus luteus UH-Slu-Lm8-n1 TaxID=930992 RepID=A0A0D0AZM4_9AGAM|nr:hypothetical protein CY34DRAFT_9185 [Suillus luteus UH-Slu-Lm8-n1]
MNTASALRQSMNDGGFADTKYYVMSKRRTWESSGETRFVYANNAVLDHITGAVQILPSPANEKSLLVHYESESMLMRDAEQNDFGPDGDSDIEEEVEEKTKAKGTEQGAPSQPSPSSYDRHSQSYSPEADFSDTTSDSSALSSDDDNTSWTKWAVTRPSDFHSESTDTLTAEPGPLPQPLSSTQQMVLVRNTAFATWASYVYYCYTGHVSFYPLKSKDPLSRRSDISQTLRCSPKSMYRLALKLENGRLEALAFQAIKSSLSKSNILDEAFSWFTAQYTGIQNMELELLMKFRSAPEVSSRLERIVEAVTQGKKPYARAMLHAFLERLTREGV